MNINHYESCGICHTVVCEHTLEATKVVKDVRPSFDTIYMNLAVDLSRRSTCLRGTKVGCVITSADHRKVIAVGYNGNAHGLPNRCDVVGEQAVGACGCCHGEMNAVVHCDASHYEPKLVYCTHLPCPLCAKLLIQLGGVKKVFYLNDYRKREGLDHLAAVGIEFEQMLCLTDDAVDLG